MKDLLNILNTSAELKRQGQPHVIATLVSLSGSSYRSLGARMLIQEGKESVGAISGGCLEADLIEQAQEVLKTGSSKLISYDSSLEDDLLWGTGLGCGGRVRVLLEKLPEPNTLPYLDFLSEMFRLQKKGVLITVYEGDGAFVSDVGQRLLVHEDLSCQDSIRHSSLKTSLHAVAQKRLAELQKATIGYGSPFDISLNEGSARIMIEPILPPIPFYVFGAGYDAIPLVSLASELGWRTTVVDHRPALTTHKRFPSALEVICASPNELEKCLKLCYRSVAVIMTHNFLQDLELLKRLLKSPAYYIGILGPRHRTERLLAALRQEGAIKNEEKKLSRLYAPIGLDIGAETPAEIALSILGEIRAVLANRQGGFLKNRKSGLHNRA